ncbi:MAG: hypothetical protein LUH01_17515 [Parabacteroides gordonii]|nr:hypothetical protein [Parabacteroides gordonii]
MNFIELMPIEAYSMPSSTFVPNDSHVMVINTARDTEWDDFDGGWGDSRTKTLQTRSNAYKQWLLNFCPPATQPTDTGITFLLNGVCHHAANRLLAVTDGKTNVRIAPGNEYSIFFFGKYGLGLADFKNRLKVSFQKTAQEYFLPNDLLDDALKRIDDSWMEELQSWRIIAEKEGGLDVKSILEKNVSGGFNVATQRLKNFIAEREILYDNFRGNKDELHKQLGALIYKHAESYLDYLTPGYIDANTRDMTLKRLQDFLNKHVKSLQQAALLWENGQLSL